MRNSERGSMHRTNSKSTRAPKAAEHRRTPKRWRVGYGGGRRTEEALQEGAALSSRPRECRGSGLLLLAFAFERRQIRHEVREILQCHACFQTVRHQRELAVAPILDVSLGNPSVVAIGVA